MKSSYRESTRDERQSAILDWARDTFGDIAVSIGERVSGLLEEALELGQAEGLTKGAALRLVEHVYDKPAGEPAQEVGGVAVCLLAYCAAAGLSAEDEEVCEFARVMALPADHFRARQNLKAAAGIAEPVGAGVLTEAGFPLLAYRCPKCRNDHWCSGGAGPPPPTCAACGGAMEHGR